MPINDQLGQRMKTYYERVPKFKLYRRTPVAIRIDGKAFHTFTRGFQKPFDETLVSAMQNTMKYLCENIQGCVLGYTQSDEITLILQDYKTFDTEAWFDYEIQKICSISASMATMAFNKFFIEETAKYCYALPKDENGRLIKESYDQWKIYQKAVEKGAMFDARCFNIPKEEITNLIYWRQLDATRNSIQMVGQANFSHSELQNKSCNDIQDMLFTQKGINWNDYPTHLKRGSCCIRKEIGYVDMATDSQGNTIPWVSTKHEWVIDKDIPIFKGENREYVEKLINFDEE